MNKFLDWWFEHTNYQTIIWECPPGKIGSGQLKTASQLAYTNTERAELYFRVTSVTKKPEHGRGGADMPGEIVGTWLDIDHRNGNNKNHRYPPETQIQELLAELPDASATVTTGGGIHCYWKLNKPISTLDNIDFLQCWHKKCANIWQDYGYLLDNVSNPDRLLRVPGSTNHKQNNHKIQATINDLTYNPDELVADCNQIPKTTTINWVDQPTLKTAYDEIVDPKQIWEEQGFRQTGTITNPNGTHYLRPNSGSNKSLTVWEDTNITTIHSTVVCDTLNLDNQHIGPYHLAEKLGTLDQYTQQAEQKLAELTTQYQKTLKKAEAGHDTSSDRFHEAAQQAILEKRLLGAKPGKENLIRPFPSHLIPDTVENACIYASQVTGAPLEMSYAVGLGCLAIPVAGRVRTDLYDTPLSLYTIVAASPGSGKSPLLRLFTQGLRDQDKKAFNKWKPHQARYKKQLDDIANQIYKQTQTDNNPAAIQALEKQYQQTEPLTVPPNLIYGKMTPASLYENLSKKGVLSVVTNEGADWLAAFRDSNNQDVTGDALLEIYDGDTVHKSTKTDGTIEIDATMSVLLLTQSGNLHKFSNLNRSGLWQRFLYIDLPQKPPIQKHKPTQTDRHPHIDNYNLLLTELADLTSRWANYSMFDPIMKVTEEAQTIFYDWQYDTRKRGHENYPEHDPKYTDDTLYEALSKCHSHAIRISGLISLCRSLDTNEIPPLTADDMTAGIGISEWFYDRRVADSIGDVNDRDSGRIEDLNWLLRQEQTITATKLAKHSTYFDRDDTKSVRAWLDELCEKGVLVKKPRSSYAKPS